MTYVWQTRCLYVGGDFGLGSFLVSSLNASSRDATSSNLRQLCLEPTATRQNVDASTLMAWSGLGTDEAPGSLGDAPQDIMSAPVRVILATASPSEISTPSSKIGHTTETRANCSSTI